MGGCHCRTPTNAATCTAAKVEEAKTNNSENGAPETFASRNAKGGFNECFTELQGEAGNVFAKQAAGQPGNPRRTTDFWET